MNFYVFIQKNVQLQEINLYFQRLKLISGFSTPLISKGYFVFSIRPKNERKISASVLSLGQIFEFSSSFFGRIEDTKKTFRN